MTLCTCDPRDEPLGLVGATCPVHGILATGSAEEREAADHLRERLVTLDLAARLVRAMLALALTMAAVGGDWLPVALGWTPAILIATGLRRGIRGARRDAELIARGLGLPGRPT